jgi:hypothetical protein
VYSPERSQGIEGADLQSDLAWMRFVEIGDATFERVASHSLQHHTTKLGRVHFVF